MLKALGTYKGKSRRIGRRKTGEEKERTNLKRARQEENKLC